MMKVKFIDRFDIRLAGRIRATCQPVEAQEVACLTRAALRASLFFPLVYQAGAFKERPGHAEEKRSC